jgi:hypothetical protein
MKTPPPIAWTSLRCRQCSTLFEIAKTLVPVEGVCPSCGDHFRYEPHKSFKLPSGGSGFLSGILADTSGFKNVLEAYSSFVKSRGSAYATTDSGMKEFADLYFSIRLGTSVGLSSEQAEIKQAAAHYVNRAVTSYLHSGLDWEVAVPSLELALARMEYFPEHPAPPSLLSILCGLLVAEGISPRSISGSRLNKVVSTFRGESYRRIMGFE